MHDPPQGSVNKRPCNPSSANNVGRRMISKGDAATTAGNT